MLGRLGKYQEALSSYDRALKIRDDKYGAWRGRGAVLDELERDEDALASYDKALSTGQKFNGVEKSLGIEMKVKDDITEEIKTKTKNAFR